MQLRFDRGEWVCWSWAESVHEFGRQVCHLCVNRTLLFRDFAKFVGQHAVRVGRQLHYHPDSLADIEARVRRIIEEEGGISLGRLRDELQTSRKFAQALLEHLDSERVTRRVGDERVLRRR